MACCACIPSRHCAKKVSTGRKPMRNCPHARVTGGRSQASRSQAVVHRRSFTGMRVNVATERGAKPPISPVSQRSSGVIISHCALAIRGTQRSSEVITGHQGKSEALGAHQGSSELIRAHRTPCAPSSSGLYLGAGSIARRPVSFESLQNLAQLASVIFFSRESNSGCAVLGISGSIDAFSRKRRSRACECEHPKSASVSRPSVSRRLIARGHQRSSEAIRGRRPSERSSEMSSEVISGQQRSTKRSSERSFKAIRGNHHTWMYTKAGNWISAIEPNMFQNAPMPARLRVCSPAAVSASMPSNSMKKSKSS